MLNFANGRQQLLLLHKHKLASTLAFLMLFLWGPLCFPQEVSVDTPQEQTTKFQTPKSQAVQFSGNQQAGAGVSASINSEISSPLIEAWAKSSGLKALTLTKKQDGEQEYSVTLQILAVMTALSFLPAILMMMTSFTRIIIVFAILRQALGLQQSPSNQILIGLSLFLTLFIMAPVFQAINIDALQPYLDEQISATQFVDRLLLPFHQFMLSQTRESDLQLFLELNGTPTLNRVEDTPMLVLIPAFVTSELKTAFQIGFIIFIPFLVIDMVVASVLMAMGMMMLSPLIISLPFKIMLFVLVDGWGMLIGTLAASYGL